MIEAKTTRRTRLNGKMYPKGRKVTMSQQQFDDLAPTGRFELVTSTSKASGAKSDASSS
ncbi:hypothetical protein [Novosphingobium sp.]|uniref:hypothetical protein n=1 Tax=Novosphingobium sp. TaxID=1874826 RepID=UPI003D6D828D